MKEKYDDKFIEEYIQKNECNRIEDIGKINKMLKLDSEIRLGINGKWGSGKTVLSHMIRFLSTYNGDSLNSFISSNFYDELKNKIVIYFDASKEDIFNNPLMSLLKVISDRLVEPNGKEEQQSEDKSIYFEIAKIFAKAKNFEDKELANNYYNTKILIEKVKELFDSEKKYLLIIDELDRSNPSYVLELLSTIKHFFDIENLSIIYMYNYDELWSIVKNKYGYSNEEYFQKFIDYEYKLNGIVGMNYAMPERRGSLDQKINICSILYQLNFREKNNLIYLIETYNYTHSRDKVYMYMDVITICHCLIKKYDVSKLEQSFIEEKMIYLEKEYYSDHIENIKMNIFDEIKNNKKDYFVNKFKDLI